MTDPATDRFAVQDVMSRYAAGVDDRDFELYRTCFADDVTIVGFGQDTIHGADAWVDYARNALARYDQTQHMLGPPFVVIDGDTAQMRTDVQALHFLKEPQGQTLTLWATYETDLVRDGGVWKITLHRLVRRGTRTAQFDA